MEGTIAAEMAIQLQDQGETVQWLGLLDTWAFSADNPRLIEIAALRANQQYEYFKTQLHQLSGDTRFFEQLYQHHATLLKEHAISDVHCSTYLFKAEVTKGVQHDEPSNYWKPYIKSPLRIYLTPGTHNTMLNEPNVVTLADYIQQGFN